MNNLKNFDISFVGLSVGNHDYNYLIDKPFFEYYNYHDFNDAELKVDLKLEKKTTFLELFFSINGSVNVNCDISNETFDEKIDTKFKLVVKFGNAYNNDNEDILIIPYNEFKINIAQYIYESIILAVPMKRLHPGIKNGTLNSDTLKKLEELNSQLIVDNNNIDPRWNDLKNIITDK